MKASLWLLACLLALPSLLCTQTIIHLNVQAPDVPVVSAGPDTTVAPGAPVLLVAVVTGGTAPFTYQWAPATALDDPTSATPVATPANPTTYTVTVSDANKCITEADVTIQLAVGIPVAAPPYIRLVPNPASGFVFIDGLPENSEQIWVEITNTSGRMVYRSPASGSSHTLALEALSPGAYIVTVHLPGGPANRILIIR